MFDWLRNIFASSGKKDKPQAGRENNPLYTFSIDDLEININVTGNGWISATPNLDGDETKRFQTMMGAREEPEGFSKPELWLRIYGQLVKTMDAHWERLSRTLGDAFEVRREVNATYSAELKFPEVEEWITGSINNSIIEIERERAGAAEVAEISDDQGGPEPHILKFRRQKQTSGAHELREKVKTLLASEEAIAKIIKENTAEEAAKKIADFIKVAYGRGRD